MNLYKYHKSPESLKHHKDQEHVVPQQVQMAILRHYREGRENDIPKEYWDVIENMSPQEVWNLLRDLKNPIFNAKNPPPRLLSILAKYPHFAIGVAKFILKDRFKEGERAIAKDPMLKKQYEQEFGVKL